MDDYERVKEDIKKALLNRKKKFYEADQFDFYSDIVDLILFQTYLNRFNLD